MGKIDLDEAEKAELLALGKEYAARSKKSVRRGVKHYPQMFLVQSAIQLIEKNWKPRLNAGMVKY